MPPCLHRLPVARRSYWFGALYLLLFIHWGISLYFFLHYFAFADSVLTDLFKIIWIIIFFVGVYVLGKGIRALRRSS